MSNRFTSRLSDDDDFKRDELIRKIEHSVEQIRLIRKFSSNLTIMYGGDNAGIKAALRGTDMALEEGMNLRIVLLPPGEDPDSFGRSHTLQEFQDYISTHEQVRELRLVYVKIAADKDNNIFVRRVLLIYNSLAGLYDAT